MYQHHKTIAFELGVFSTDNSMLPYCNNNSKIAQTFQPNDSQVVPRDIGIVEPLLLITSVLHVHSSLAKLIKTENKIHYIIVSKSRVHDLDHRMVDHM